MRKIKIDKELIYKFSKLISSVKKKEHEWFENILQIKRVTKILRGGKFVSFRVLIAIGNLNSFLGIGIGKSYLLSTAIEKALKKAQKTIIKIPLTKNYSIPTVIKSKHSAATILLKPARLANGISAGKLFFILLKLSGIKNLTTKQLQATNFINNSKAFINGFNYLNKKITQTVNNNSEAIRKLKKNLKNSEI